MDRNVGNLDSQFRIVACDAGGPVHRRHRPVGRRRPRPARVGLLQRCPAYALLGIDTCTRDRS